MIYKEVIINSFFSLIMFLIFIAVIAWIFSIRKTKKYRQELGDMYVAAKIREIAGDEKLNLDEEFEAFKKWEKKEDAKYKNYDSMVEEELSEKVSEKLTKQKAKKKE